MRRRRNIKLKRKASCWHKIFWTFCLIALLAPLLSNRDPLLVKVNNQWFSPGLNNKPYIIIEQANGQLLTLRKTEIDWKTFPADWILFAPVTYNPGSSDPYNMNYRSPFEKQFYATSDGSIAELPARHRHWLGTGKTGADVLAGLIHGTRFSLLIGILSILMASVIGLFLGGIAGYFGDRGLSIKKFNVLFIIILLVPVILLSLNFPMPGNLPSALQIFLRLLLVAIQLLLLTKLPYYGKSSYLQSQITIPVDSILSRIIEIFISLPRLVLILTLAAMIRPSVTTIILVIGLSSWTELARIFRAELLKWREALFTESARAMAFPPIRIIFFHLLPNAIAPLRVAIIFGIAGAILVESALSFLGIGVPQDVVTWGSLLASGREQFSAWWLILLPGIALFLLLYSLNHMGAQSKFRKIPVFH